MEAGVYIHKQRLEMCGYMDNLIFFAPGCMPLRIDNGVHEHMCVFFDILAIHLSI